MSLKQDQVGLRLNPNSVINYENMADVYLELNRLDDAEAILKEAERRNLEDEGLLQARYQLAFVKGDTAGMAKVVAGSLGKPGSEEVLVVAQANTEAWYGRLTQGRGVYPQSYDVG